MCDASSDASSPDALSALLALMARLRDPQRGCPWDRAQDFASIAPYTIEEAYELAAAIERQDPERIRDELGDLLFQVVFHARLAEERGWFDFHAVARGIHDKLVRRHPHVFGGGTDQDPATLSQQWEAGKRAERAERGEGGTLADVPLALPALTRAAKLGRRAAQVGFDWPEPDGARRKLDEELAEFDAAAHACAHADADDVAGRAALEDELGDVLFSTVNLARHHRIDPEGALRAANAKFERRFAAMEQLAREQDIAIHTLDPDAWERLWVQAKVRLRAAVPRQHGPGGDGTA
jgi:ATP diphosphatase